MKLTWLSILVLLSAKVSFAGYYPWGDMHWKAPVASVAALPASGNQPGDVRTELTAFGEYVWNGSGWIAITGSGGAPGGANTDVQFNSGGSFGGSANLTWSGTVLGVVGSVNASNFTDSALTSGLPVFSTAPFSTGTLTGNTTKLVTASGAYTPGDGLQIDASGNVVDTGAPPATVSSVGFSAPGEFTVSGSPVTGSGTLTLTKASEAANTFWGAPNGSAGAPTFRLLVGADIPNFGGATGVANGVQGGVPQPLAGQQNDCLLGSGGWGACGTGTVTSVGLSDGSTTPIYSISGSPVTGSGTLSFTLKSQTANTVLAGPNGVAGQPLFRNLVGADLPNPTLSTLGGVESLTCSAGQALNAISTTGVPSCASVGSTYTASDSITLSAGNFTLVNDSASPAASNYYGTDSGGVLGYHLLPTGFTNPMTTLGDTMYGGASGTATRLAGNTTTNMAVYTQTGTGSASAAPAWTLIPTINGNNIFNLNPAAFAPASFTTNGVIIANSATGIASTAAIGIGGIIQGNGSGVPSVLPLGTAFQYLQVNSGATGLTYTTAVPGSPTSWSGYDDSISGNCTTTSATYADPSACTGITLHTIVSNSISCSAAASSAPGITCTLPSTGIYEVYASVVMSNGSNNQLSARLVDGSGTVIDPGNSQQLTAGNATMTRNLRGLYSAASTSITFKVQIAGNGATTNIQQGIASGTPAINWVVESR